MYVLLHSLQETCLCTGFSELKAEKIESPLSFPIKDRAMPLMIAFKYLRKTVKSQCRSRVTDMGRLYYTQNTITFITLRILVPVLSLTTVEMT